MTEFEVDAILTAYNNKYKEEWERTRWLAYIYSLPYSDNIKKPQDLVTFGWEEIPMTLKPKTPEELEKIKADMLKVAGVL